MAASNLLAWCCHHHIPPVHRVLCKDLKFHFSPTCCSVEAPSSLISSNASCFLLPHWGQTCGVINKAKINKKNFCVNCKSTNILLLKETDISRMHQNFASLCHFQHKSIWVKAVIVRDALNILIWKQRLFEKTRIQKERMNATLIQRCRQRLPCEYWGN